MNEPVTISLAAWPDFEALMSAHKWEWGQTANATLSRANARFRAATNMEVSFGGYKTEDTPTGHADILKAAMAYTAADALMVGIKEHSKEFKTPKAPVLTIPSQEIANAYREPGSIMLRDALRRLLTKESLKRELDNLESGETINVRSLSEGIRHLALHGLFTPATIGYSGIGGSMVVPRLLKSLRTETLRATDSHFADWCASLPKTPSDVQAG